MGRSKASIMAGVTDEVVKSRVVGNNTVEFTTAGGIRVIRLHDTNIIAFRPDGSIKLNSGGWRTVTTKDRINQHCKSIRIWSYKGVWILGVDGRKYVFADGMIIQHEGTVEGAGV